MANEAGNMGDEVDLKLLLRKRGNIKQKLKGFINFFTPINQAVCQDLNVGERTINELQIRIEKLVKVFNEYEEVQSSIELNCELAKLEEHYKDREDFTSLHTETLASANLIFDKLTKNEGLVMPVLPPPFNPNIGQNIMPNTFNMNLPPIKLPVFNGEHNRWLEYRETFESLIHNNGSLREIQKFHYLRASLGEGAIRVIDSLEFSSQNYTKAWDLICKRFDNSRLLVNNHLKAIFNLEALAKESVVGLRNLIDTLNKHLRALKSLGLPTEYWDAWLIYLISVKLDKGTARSWEQENDKSLPSFSDFLKFLSNCADFLESLEVKHSTKVESKVIKSNYSFFSKENDKMKCFLCEQHHAIYNCNVFLAFSVSERWDKVKDLKLCSNCLCKGHFSKVCKFYPCKKCKYKHHTLLHSNFQSRPSSERSEVQGHLSNRPKERSEVEQTLAVTQEVNNSEVSVALSSQSSRKEYVLLSTAEILVKNRHGKFCSARAVLDSGSQSCFVSERFCKEMGLTMADTNISVVGINNEVLNLQKRCDVTIKSQYNEFSMNMSCLVLPKITENLPLFDINVSCWDIPTNVVLADPNYFISQTVDLLIGAKYFWNILKDGKIYLGKNLPVLQNTEFGYVLSGAVNLQEKRVGLLSHNNIKDLNKTVINSWFVTNEQIHEDMMKFWAVEEAGPYNKLLEDDEICENHFLKEHCRNFEGRFVVRIPLKEPPTELGDTKALAIKRFLNLERKFAVNENFKIKYKEFMAEYEYLEHMELENSTKNCELDVSYFLPHHGVIREESLSTKLRVVFDGSAVPSKGKSINEIQFKGPPIQNNIFQILVRFRARKIAVTADITKMYRQILVNPEDRYLQKIVWRDDPNKSLSTFVLNTVTYGMVSSPYLAIRCIKQLAFENEKEFSVASKIILNDFYVDDLISGFDSVEEATQFCLQISNILSLGCFPLRKWSSNSFELLAKLKDTSEPLSILKFGDDKQVKTLGIQWISSFDNLTFHIKCLDISCPATKRNVLSSIAKIFDPLGLLGPCIIVVKILIQALWALKLDWDENIPPDLEKCWNQFRNNLVLFNSLKIPRCVLVYSEKYSSEIHGFCDSSQKAYCAVIYMRSFDDRGKPQVNLVCSKTKVAPLKAMTVPRLELCGALLLARLIKTVKEALQSNVQCFLWCDSQIVLHWVHTPLDKLQIFVRNRIAEIRNLTDLDCWRYVNTKENPADLATRGITPRELVTSVFWWHGPEFLRNDEIEWPEKMVFSNNIELPDLITKKSCVLKVNEINDYKLFRRFSSFKKLVRVQSYCCRFLYNCKLGKAERGNRLSGSLLPKELEIGIKTLVRVAQAESFSFEINLLKKGGYLKPKHRLLSLSPFIDSEGLLRVGGRLKNAQISYDKKHPMLLDGKHLLSKLIFEYEHIELKHAGPQLVLFAVREKYWPTNGMNVIKGIVRKCLTCFKSKPRGCNAIMSDLPSNRVTISAPFNVTGVDYAGPYILKDRKGRGTKQFKAYICLFICFATKAVHLELVTDLSTEAFIATFRRFSARRGKPSHMYSDNGSNFIGADRELSKLYKFLSDSSKEISTKLSDYRTEWHFIPPRSPTFGGLWESNIKGVKFHLKRVIQNTILTYEEFSTVLVQIEAILNSRPLYPLSSDPSDLETLTPSHFLIGRPIINAPDPSVENVKVSSLSRYQLLQRINQDFWKRWSKCYLNQLQQKSKWRQSFANIPNEALVLLKDNNLPPCRWLLGRVTATHAGSDGVVRVVTVRTSKGEIKRAITQICPLPDSDPDSTNSVEPTGSTRGSMEKKEDATTAL